MDNLRPLAELTALTSVELYRCNLSNLQALSCLTGLLIARLHANPKIRDISPLSTLHSLTRLQASVASPSLIWLRLAGLHLHCLLQAHPCLPGGRCADSRLCPSHAAASWCAAGPCGT